MVNFDMLSHLITALVAFTLGFLAAGLFFAVRHRDDAHPWPTPPGTSDEPA